MNCSLGFKGRTVELSDLLFFSVGYKRYIQTGDYVYSASDRVNTDESCNFFCENLRIPSKKK